MRRPGIGLAEVVEEYRATETQTRQRRNKAMSSQPSVTAGIDLGDRHSHICLIDTENGEVVEESRIPTTPEAFRRRFRVRSRYGWRSR